MILTQASEGSPRPPVTDSDKVPGFATSFPVLLKARRFATMIIMIIIMINITIIITIMIIMK